MVASEGFCHLNAIKGADWKNVYIYGMKLVPLSEDATAVSSIATQAQKNGKFMKGGKIVILKNGKAYNAMGIQQ